ncbi:MAG: putative hydrolase [Haloplasmataceae bacterium]|nr:putative hydrolase [Haloplasmataceae bacterium]
MQTTKFFIKDYPRPQFVRNNYLNLNGSWDFAFDDELKGEVEKWFENFPKQANIVVPFTYQTPLSGINKQEYHPYVWYHRLLDLNDEQLKNKRVILHLEGSDYFTKVYINGKYVDHHKGGYTRFSVDITHYLMVGENKIVYRIEDDLSCTKPRGKQRWLDHSFGCWYVETTGIWKTVWCEFVSENYLKDVKMTPHLENFTLEVNEFDLLSDIHPFKIQLWSRYEPKLYDIEFCLYRNGIKIDQVGSYFGVRDITINNNCLNINDTPTYLKMTLDQGYWKESHLTPPDEAALLLDINRTLEMGYNGVRKHQKIEDERFLYYCDVLGLYVWEEMPSIYEFNDEMVTNFTTEWLEIVKQHYNHPSIITWVPFNESWGLQSLNKNRMQQHFTEQIYHLTKSIDAMRPVVCNDGWEHTISDIITLHNYYGNGELIEKCYKDIKSTLNNSYSLVLPPRNAFAKGYEYKGQPIMISEYGGIGFEKDKEKGWGYGKLANNEQDFINRLKNLTQTIFKLDFCCGFCITQTTDVQQELNGLLYENREPKVPLIEIRKINQNE